MVLFVTFVLFGGGAGDRGFVCDCDLCVFMWARGVFFVTFMSHILGSYFLGDCEFVFVTSVFCFGGAGDWEDKHLSPYPSPGQKPTSGVFADS